MDPSAGAFVCERMMMVLFLFSLSQRIPPPAQSHARTSRTSWERAGWVRRQVKHDLQAFGEKRIPRESWRAKRSVNVRSRAPAISAAEIELPEFASQEVITEEPKLVG